MSSSSILACCADQVTSIARTGAYVTEKTIDGSGKIFKDLEATNHKFRIFHSSMMMLNAYTGKEYLPELLAGVKFFTEAVTARHWVPKISEFASGEVLTPPIKVAGGTVPDVLRVASRVTLLVADLCSFISFLHKYKVLETIALVAVGTAAIPVFSVGSVPFIAVMTTCGTFGFMFDLADQFRLVTENGLTTEVFFKIISDVSKITFIVLAPYQTMKAVSDLFYLCHIANVTSSAATLSGFVYKKVL
jgi:hypothetical protein